MTRLELAIIPRKSCAFPGAPPRIKKGGGSEFGVCLRKKEKHRLKTMLRFGADDEARTRYLHLGKVALYQMSYIRMFCFLLFARNDIYYTA